MSTLAVRGSSRLMQIPPGVKSAALPVEKRVDAPSPGVVVPAKTQMTVEKEKKPVTFVRPTPSPEKLAMDQKILDLVQRFRDGDERAFEELAPLAGKMAYHLALRSVADSNSAEDIAQEALVRLYKHVHEMEGLGAFKTWFYRVVLNLVHDHYRRNSRRDSAMDNLEDVRQLEVRSKSQPLSDMERNALRNSLQGALESLDDKHREVFLLKEVEGMGHAEIAVHLGVPEGTVWSRLSYARKKLQEKLRRQGHAP